MEQSDILLQRFSICDVLRSETEQKLGRRNFSYLDLYKCEKFL